MSLSVDSFGRFAVVTWFLNGLSLFHLHLALQFWLFSKFLFVYFSLIDRLSIGLILKGCHVFSVSRLFCPHLFLVGWNRSYLFSTKHLMNRLFYC